MKYDCEIIKDLMPLYHDGVCSDKSKEIVEEHLHECSECKAYYDMICASDDIENEFFDKEKELKTAKSLQAFTKKVLKKAVLTVSTVVMLLFVLCMGLLLWLDFDQKYNKETYTDIAKYETDREEFFTEEMKEIWPEHVQASSQYKLISYYDDATAYTGYIKVSYDETSFNQEKERLAKTESTEYVGKYGNSGFAGEILAIKAYEPGDSKGKFYKGFTYALALGNNEIVYIELQFPRDMPREDYKKIIPDEYLPRDLTFQYQKHEYTLKDRLIWGGMPIVIAVICGYVSYRLLRKKRKIGILVAIFAIMLFLFGIMNFVV